jgi:RNA polymerase sigma-70 factor (ECF subfamily)
VSSFKTTDVERLFREHAPFVQRSLRRFGLSESDADDLCQDVFLIVLAKIEDFEQRSSFRVWLYGIANRVALASRRRASAQRERPTEPLPEVAADGSPHHELEQREARRVLEEALWSLDEDKRAVFVLYELEQFTMNEVAEAVGCPLQTAYSRLHAAREKVDAVIQRRSKGWRYVGLLKAMLGKTSASVVGAAALTTVVGTTVVTSVTSQGLARPSLLTAQNTASRARSSSLIVQRAPPPPAAEVSAAPPPKVLPAESEAALLGRAQDALADRPGQSLALCAKHQASFPQGNLTQEREVIAIDALVRLGRAAEAEARADRFESSYPTSGHRRRIDSLLGR